jgi:iron complex outermembrane receptor protein
MKSKLIDGRMRLNATAFIMDYEDMQISASSDAVTTASTKANLGDATMRGVEIEMTALIAENFTLGINAGFLDDKIDSLKGVLISNLTVIGKDNELPMTPDWTFSLMAKYEMPLVSGALLSFRADYSVKDDYHTRAENISETLIDDYKNLNLNGTYISANGFWEASVGVRNATDAEYYQSATPFATFGEVFGQPIRPRTSYVGLKYNFSR